MTAGHALDAAVAAVVLTVLAALWFAWVGRHVRGLWTLGPIIGAVSAVVIAFRGVMEAVDQWGGGSVVDGGTIGLYTLALALQGALTRLITGFLAGRDLSKLVPATVALSMIVHVLVLGELLRVDDMYRVALFCLVAVALSWPIGSLGRLLPPHRTPMTFAATGILLGIVLLGGAAHALV